MEKTPQTTASETLEETLKRLTAKGGRMDTFLVSIIRSKKSGEVLYLEAGKDFIDTLLGLLLLPVGTIIHMLSTGVPPEKPNSAISSLFQSVENLDRNCILAQPTPAANFPSIGLLQLCQDADAKKKKLVLSKQFYKCHNCNSLSSKREARCYNCWPQNGTYKINCHFLQGPYPLSDKEVQRQNDLVAELEPVEEYNRTTTPGFVKENITFMLTHKLEIMPSTTIIIMSALKEMKINSLADLESKKITVTTTQVLQLIQSALTSSSCLDDVFGIGETGRIA